MSIEIEIRNRRAEGRLVLHQPLLDGSQDRAVFVESELYGEIVGGALVTNPTAFRIGQLVRDIDRFSAGDVITVGYGRERSCFMKQLDPRADEVWEIRSRDPQPSYRLFCRFAQPDVLVVLSVLDRRYLGAEGSQEWGEAIRKCKTMWRQLFPTYDPFKGTSANDYITKNVIELDHFA